MKRIFTFLGALSLFAHTHAQNYQWTWMHGSNTTNPATNYYAPKLSTPETTPGGITGARGGGPSGDFLFLDYGYGIDREGREGFLEQPWRYSIATGEWVTYFGPEKAIVLSGPPLYGEKGVAGPMINPGGGRIGAVSWRDNRGDLWLFGGRSADGMYFYNDLWTYNSSTRLWTWVSGDKIAMPPFGGVYNPPVFGTKGVAAAENKPGARNGAVSWTDKEGDLWLFGGIGWAQNNGWGDINDLWEYDIATNTWTWWGGGETTFRYSFTSPGSRYNATGKVDADGNLWLFGGFGASRTFFQKQLDDLWHYNTTTHTWTLRSGDNLNYTGSDAGALAYMQQPVYGTKGVAAPTSKPGAVPSSFAQNRDGQFWLLGGGDLWQFNPATSQWTWIESMGANTHGNYGTKGVRAATNKPGTRTGSALWADEQGNVWLMGGRGLAASGPAGLLNDLWKLSPATEAYVLSCTPSKTVNTERGVCVATVTGIDPVLTPASAAAKVTYTLTGATDGSGTGTASGRIFKKGTTSVRYTAGSQSCQFTVTVTDNQDPVLSRLTTSVTELWPADHKMQQVRLNYTVNDNCGVTRTEVSVSSTEEESGLGNGDKPNDWEIVNDHLIRLRAERSNRGPGRVYTITVRTWDAAGNISSERATVTVPKNKNGKDPKEIHRLLVKALPTLTRTYFTLVIESGIQLPVFVRIYDEKGRTLEVRLNLQPNSTITLGHQYRPGVYYAEVYQGSEKKVVKLIKQ